jgi:cytochrome c oxidase subunit IV
MSHADQGERRVHVVSAQVLLRVWGALLALTFITVAVTWVNLGPLGVPVAIGIATVKAILVALFFMHLKYDRPFNAVVLVASIFFVILFLGLALLDTLHYRDNLIPGYAPGLAAPAPAEAPAGMPAGGEAPAPGH